jgi:hypothetical protein
MGHRRQSHRLISTSKKHAGCACGMRVKASNPPDEAMALAAANEQRFEAA